MCLLTVTHSKHKMCSELQCCLFSVLWCWTLQDNYGQALLSHSTWFVCFWILCLKYFLIKHLVIKSWLHVWSVWLMSRFSERDWHSLLITVCAHESHYDCSWLLLHTDTDGDNKPISAASCAERRESSQKDRPASSLFVWTHPLLDLGSLPELSPHQCGGVLWQSCTHKQTYSFILPVLCTVHHCIFPVFMLRCKKKKKNPNYLCILSEWERRGIIAEGKWKRMFCRDL